VGAAVLDGEALASIIKDDLRGRIAAVRETFRAPGLATLLVGDDEPSARYVAMKHRDSAELGIDSLYEEHLPATATQEEVLAVVDRFNTDPRVDSMLLQHPFPPHLDYESALLTADPDKDVDGLHPVNLGRLVMGAEGPLPCTPYGIQRLLAHYGVPIEGRSVVIIGRGLTIGRPLANLLSLKRPDANAAVTVVHTGVSDLADHVRRADIVVAAAGSPGLVTPDMIKPGAAVVAAGARYQGRKVLSDVVDEVAEVAGWLTPRIGGVGPMTRAMLLSNCVDAAERHAARDAV
jgi:methylenetetrahydrofolate dehydrogenase (NADP+) / methenyltetrahydrofolate cyclohydrolase